MIEDLLYEEIKKEGSKRTDSHRITGNNNSSIEIVYDVTTLNGQDNYDIKSITITSSSTMTVTVDGKIIIQPPEPPTYTDDCCYFREKPMISQPIPANYAWGIVKNGWVPSDFGYVGYKK